MKKSKIIACVIATKGTRYDSSVFTDLVTKIKPNGFQIKKLLADARYSEKIIMLSIKEPGILNVFIDFKNNATLSRAKSDV